MAKVIHVENETKELIALQALETYRALQYAVRTAPHGKGLVTVEAMVHDKGFAQLRAMYEAAIREHPAAQKKSSSPICGEWAVKRPTTALRILVLPDIKRQEAAVGHQDDSRVVRRRMGRVHDRYSRSS